MKKIAVLFLLVLLVGCSNDKVELLSYGLVDNETIATEKNSNLLSGNIHIINSWNLIEETTLVPNDLGVEFGIAYRITGAPNQDIIKVEEVIIFPEGGLTNSDTGESSKSDSERLMIISGEDQYISYTFDHPWEAKSGKWTFQVKRDGVVVLEKSFYVSDNTI